MVILIIATYITTFLVQPHRIPSGSMEPTLLIGDFVLVTKNTYINRYFSPLPHPAIHRGEIIVFLKPNEPDTHLVKRVIGLPGDRIHLTINPGHPFCDRVFVNGKLLDEPYADYLAIPGSLFRDYFPAYPDQDASILPTWQIQLRRATQGGDLIVPPHNYFVLGDNRNDSLDSRYWGFVPEANIIGTPWLVYFSLRNNSYLPQEFPDLYAATPPSSLSTRILNRIANFARWDRTLHLVQ